VRIWNLFIDQGSWVDFLLIEAPEEDSKENRYELKCKFDLKSGLYQFWYCLIQTKGLI
jgi:hypothetical protein